MTRVGRVLVLDDDDATLWLGDERDQGDLVETAEAVASEIDDNVVVVDSDGDLFAFFSAALWTLPRRLSE